MYISLTGFVFPVAGGCDIEFNVFITSAPDSNLFVYQYDADIFANTFDPPRQVEQQTYSCSNDVSIQYVYYEVTAGITCEQEYAQFLLEIPRVYPTLALALAAYPGLPVEPPYRPTFPATIPYITRRFYGCLADGFQTQTIYWAVIIP